MSASPSTLDELASTLVNARAALGITQNELHKRTGISREAIKGYESGRNKPGARELKLLCEALQVSPNVLLFGTESPFESKGALYDLLSENGQLDWMKFSALFTLLTVKEKLSILTLIESLLLGRHSHEEIMERVKSIEVMSGLFAAMVAQAKQVQSGERESIDPREMANQLEEFMESRTKDHKKPG